MNQSCLKYLGIGLIVCGTPMALFAEALNTASNPYHSLAAVSPENDNSRQITGKTATGDRETTIVDTNGNLKMVPSSSGAQSSDNQNVQNVQSGLQTNNLVNQNNRTSPPPSNTPMSNTSGMTSSSPGSGTGSPAPLPSQVPPTSRPAQGTPVPGVSPTPTPTIPATTPAPTPNPPVARTPLSPPSPLTAPPPAAPLTPPAIRTPDQTTSGTSGSTPLASPYTQPQNTGSP